MAVESIGTVTDSSKSLQQAGLGQEDFLKVLLTQLSFQDPLKPMDNQEFIAQMAQFTNLELTRQQNDNVNSLLTIQSATQAIGLIGKTVEVQTSTGSQVGSVTTINFQRGSPSLTVKTDAGEFLTDVSLSQVVIVR
ncbi:MAG: flagellar hook capping protein [Gammaproteobacteria bacterium]|nr:flagellar hook capping protein [Gammaproteobacteria bacterium]